MLSEHYIDHFFTHKNAKPAVVTENCFQQYVHTLLLIMFILSSARFSNCADNVHADEDEHERQVWNTRCSVHRTAEWHLYRKFFTGSCNTLFKYSY